MIGLCEILSRSNLAVMSYGPWVMDTTSVKYYQEKKEEIQLGSEELLPGHGF